LKVRRPAQAGAFYAGNKSQLEAQIRNCFLHELGPRHLPQASAKGQRRIVALVSPHAGYMYSGPVAASGYDSLATDGTPEAFIILGPNHSGLGSGVSIMTEGRWQTPLGESSIDSDIANLICEHSSIIDVDDDAHAFEHSIEVQLPFLQYVYRPEIRFVPICMMMQDLRTSVEVGEAIAKATGGRDVVIIASSDMTHYEPQKSAEKKDRTAIDSILKLDEKELQDVVESKNISMCGYGAVSSAIRCAKTLGASKANLLNYKTSGDITGDYDAVVGYASIAISK